MTMPHPLNTPFATSRGPIVGEDPRIREAIEAVRRVASSDCAVLVTGESGTGKELIVAALHDASERRNAQLVSVNCSAIPSAAIDSELFGTDPSASSVQAIHTGCVHAAEGGTLFLDEISDLPLPTQAKVLRLLQAREYTRTGEETPTTCDVRVVAATNRTLETCVAKNLFREDLFYRLNVVHVHMPPLRERGDDITRLADHCLRNVIAQSGRHDLVGFSEDAYALLRASDWPGNVRALQHAVERAALLGRGPMVTAQDFGPTVHAGAKPPAFTMPVVLPVDGIDMRRAVREFENELLRQALERTKGNKNRAAQLLGLNRTTLVEMVKRKKLA